MLKALTEKYIVAFSEKDIDGVAALMADGFILEDPVVKRIKGKGPALEAIAKIFSGCEVLSFMARNIFQDGNTTLIEFVLELDATRLEGVDVIAWRDGQMVELRAYLDVPKG